MKMNELSNFINHSGGALGSDTYWGEIGEKYGVKSNHYYYSEKTPNGNIEISQEDFEEGRYESAKAAKYNFGYTYKTMRDHRLIRNWAQVKYSDAVFAIGHIVNPGEKLFPNQINDTRIALNIAVTGGTGYAVAMAILHNKPVYVFDQERFQIQNNGFVKSVIRHDMDGLQAFPLFNLPVLCRPFARVQSLTNISLFCI